MSPRKQRYTVEALILMNRSSFQRQDVSVTDLQPMSRGSSSKFEKHHNQCRDTVFGHPNQATNFLDKENSGSMPLTQIGDNDGWISVGKKRRAKGKPKSSKKRLNQRDNQRDNYQITGKHREANGDAIERSAGRFNASSVAKAPMFVPSGVPPFVPPPPFLHSQPGFAPFPPQPLYLDPATQKIYNFPPPGVQNSFPIFLHYFMPSPTVVEPKESHRYKKASSPGFENVAFSANKGSMIIHSGS